MKPKDKLRLALLLAKDAGDLTDAEKQDLETLKARASEKELDIDQIAKDFAPDAEDEGEGEGSEDGKSVGEDELAELITKAVAKAGNNSGIDVEAFKNDLKELKESGKGLTADEVEAIVVKHQGGNGIDKEALVEEIKGMIPSTSDFEAKLTGALSKFAASVKAPSKNQFSEANEFEKDYPFEYREENLTVAQKQLANICLANASGEVKAGMKSVPTDMNDGITSEQLNHARKRGAAHAKAARHATLYGGKALTTSGVGAGAELVPTDLSTDLQVRMYLDSQLASELIASEIDMPTDPFKFPLVTTRTNFFTGSELPANNPQSSEPGTGELELSAKKLIGMSEYSYEADEDAIFAMLPLLQENLSSGAADAFEGAVINGDLSATHQDSDVAGINGHHAKLFKGLRKYASDGGLNVDLSAGGINKENIVAMRKRLNQYSTRPRDLMLIVGPQGYNDLVALEDTLTFDKVGSQSAARILTGEASSIFGIRIVISSQIREDLNADGVYDGANTNKGSILLVHRPTWLVGVKRGFMVEIEQDKKRQFNSVIASFRRDLKPKEDPSESLPTVVFGHNYDA